MRAYLLIPATNLSFKAVRLLELLLVVRQRVVCVQRDNLAQGAWGNNLS